jgi:hypothetical protein
MNKLYSVIATLVTVVGFNPYLALGTPHTTTIVQAQTNQNRPKKLTSTEIQQVRRALPKKEIITEQAFKIYLPDFGDCFFVPVEENSPSPKLSLYLVKNNKVIYTFPKWKQAQPWNFLEIKAVSFPELHFDGPDIDGVLLIADYYAGAGGPGISKPFPVTILYEIVDGKKLIKVLEKESNTLTKRQVKSIAQAEKILRDEFQYLP